MRRLTPHLSTFAAAARLRLRGLWLRLPAASPGQGLVEYGLILVLIMVVCVAILSATGQTLSEVWYEKLLPAFPAPSP